MVFPEKDMAQRLATRLETSRVLDIVNFSEKINISKMYVPDILVGKNVVDANLRSRFNINIIAVENNGDVLETVTPDYIFRDGDILYLSGSREGLGKLSAWLE